MSALRHVGPKSGMIYHCHSAELNSPELASDTLTSVVWEPELHARSARRSHLQVVRRRRRSNGGDYGANVCRVSSVDQHLRGTEPGLQAVKGRNGSAADARLSPHASGDRFKHNIDCTVVR